LLLLASQVNDIMYLFCTKTLRPALIYRISLRDRINQIYLNWGGSGSPKLKEMQPLLQYKTKQGARWVRHWRVNLSCGS